jgi:hypothetical protein
MDDNYTSIILDREEELISKRSPDDIFRISIADFKIQNGWFLISVTGARRMSDCCDIMNSS